MITPEQWQKRVAKLYSNDRDRWRKKLEKSLPKGVTLDLRPGQILPYTQRDFEAWMWTKIQLGAILCPYCRAAIDILNMELDHKIPLRRGGDMSFENRDLICARCNKIKQDFTYDEFAVIVAFMEGPAAHFRQRLEGVLINGGVGAMMRHFPHKKKAQSGPKKIQQSLYFDELGEF